MKTWVIVGASRGIGKEFVRQLLARGDRVLATVRNHKMQSITVLWPDDVGKAGPCQLLSCDMLSEQSINTFAAQVAEIRDLKIDHLILNAGVLKYPNRATDVSYNDFLLHMQTNTIGPVLTAQQMLKSGIPISSIVFVSSDSGSVSQFNDFEDGFAAYGASKAALNQSLRHMAAELRRSGRDTTVLALHPGEVQTDMANIDLPWEVQGQLTVEDSVRQCLQTIESKGPTDSGTFWTWDNRQHPW